MSKNIMLLPFAQEVNKQFASCEGVLRWLEARLCYCLYQVPLYHRHTAVISLALVLCDLDAQVAGRMQTLRRIWALDDYNGTLLLHDFASTPVYGVWVYAYRVPPRAPYPPRPRRSSTSSTGINQRRQSILSLWKMELLASHCCCSYATAVVLFFHTDGVRCCLSHSLSLLEFLQSGIQNAAVDCCRPAALLDLLDPIRFGSFSLFLGQADLTANRCRSLSTPMTCQVVGRVSCKCAVYCLHMGSSCSREFARRT